MILLLLACAPDAVENAPPSPELAELPAPRLLRRMSLDLRGTLPSAAELDAVEADPSLIDATAAAYLDAPTASDRLVGLLAERWQTVMDAYAVRYTDYGLDESEADRFAHAVGEEPLRLIAHIVAEDRPWSEVVTADYTMADGLLGRIWPLARESEGEGWEVARYTDGRPAAGVLATNGFYWRYVTNVSNKNRARVAALSRLLLCDDILGRPVTFERSQELDPEDALRTVPACVSCHATVDPIAASFFGFWWVIGYNADEMERYHPERERLGPSLLGTEPGWYGTPTGGLVDLGWYLSHDPRFDRCAAQAFAEQLWRRPSTVDDFETLTALTDGFVAAGESPRALIQGVLATDAYRAGGFTADATDGTRSREIVERLLSPNQLRLALQDLAGLDWREGGYVALENDVLGYRTLAGGVDGYSVTATATRPGLTYALVHTRVAQAAAQLLVVRDLGAAAPALLTVAPDALPGTAAFDDQLRALSWRLYAERPDDAWITRTGELWSAVAAVDGSAAAWEAVIEAMLRDPRFVSY